MCCRYISSGDNCLDKRLIIKLSYIYIIRYEIYNYFVNLVYNYASWHSLPGKETVATAICFFINWAFSCSLLTDWLLCPNCYKFVEWQHSKHSRERLIKLHCVSSYVARVPEPRGGVLEPFPGSRPHVPGAGMGTSEKNPEEPGSS